MKKQVEVNRSGLTGSIALIVIGVILVLAAVVFYFVKNTSLFALTMVIIGVISVILGIAILFYTQSFELRRQKKEKLSHIEELSSVTTTDKPVSVCGNQVSKPEIPKAVINVEPNSSFNSYFLDRYEYPSL